MSATADDISTPARALPFWLSLSLVPVLLVAAALGGWWLVAVPLYTWGVLAAIDALVGRDLRNADPATPEADLFWYRLVTLIWPAVQIAVIFGMIWWATGPGGYTGGEKLALFFGVGVLSGTVGINYAHELMHQKNRGERWLGDILMALALYGHFRSEHLRVHHAWVGTPRDPVTARYNEGFHRYFLRVLATGLPSAWRAERLMLARAGRPVWHRRNPFWRYAGLQAAMVALALWLGGLAGLALFAWQAGVAVWQLELTNYVEHYGLTRRHLGDGRYEHVQPHHSWNAAHTASNWLLINLQRHSDHHFRPQRRFPLLQTWSEDKAPQLPLGYPAMTALAMIPPLWRRRMNPRVRAWRRAYYPDITDWTPYREASLPWPRES